MSSHGCSPCTREPESHPSPVVHGNKACAPGPRPPGPSLPLPKEFSQCQSPQGRGEPGWRQPPWRALLTALGAVSQLGFVGKDPQGQGAGAQDRAASSVCSPCCRVGARAFASHWG